MTGDIGANIRRYRKAAGLTQAEVASAVGRSRASIANLEQGRQDVGLYVFAELPDVLGCSADDLLGRTATPPGNGAEDDLLAAAAVGLRSAADYLEGLREARQAWSRGG